MPDDRVGPVSYGLWSLTYPTGAGYVGLEVNEMWHWYQMGWWGWLMMLVFWAVVVFLVVWTVRTATAPQPKERNTALDILDERLARGEIERQEYEERRQILAPRK